MQKSDENPLLIVVSNRGPFSFSAKKNGRFNISRGAGGLVTALFSLAEQQDVIWFASALSRGDKLWVKQNGNKAVDVQGIQLRLVAPNSTKQYNQYYNIISNPLLWFIQHQLWDIPRNPSITSETWRAWEDGYVAMNEQFANVVADEIDKLNRDVIILPQDYHLYMLPKFLRQRLGYDVQIQPFVHIPWPGPDVWLTLPEQVRTSLLDSLLQSNRIGFQTQRDAFNFVQTARFHLDDAHSHGSRNSIQYRNREIGAIAYPISIDIEALKKVATNQTTITHVKNIKNYVGERQLIVRIDRVEPSKNIIRGLEAFRDLITRYPQHRGKVQMLALLVPSRMGVEQYQNYLQDIMAEAGMINAEYGDGMWEPIRILLGNNYSRAIAAMKVYDVLLVNPLADGMNLVAKEGPIVNENDGVLVLSERAGAFYELGEQALSISPYDVYSTAEALHHGLTMPKAERRRRSNALKTIINNASVEQWLHSQVYDAVTALNNHDKNSSTPETPSTNRSEFSFTDRGISLDATPIAKE